MYGLFAEPGYDEEMPLMEDIYGSAIYVGDTYYEFGDEIVSEYNIDEWLSNYRREADDPKWDRADMERDM